MAPHNNVKIYNAFFRKNYVLFAFILIKKYDDIIKSRWYNQTWTIMNYAEKCRTFYYHAYFFHKEY